MVNAISLVRTWILIEERIKEKKKKNITATTTVHTNDEKRWK